MDSPVGTEGCPQRQYGSNTHSSTRPHHRRAPWLRAMDGGQDPSGKQRKNTPHLGQMPKPGWQCRSRAAAHCPQKHDAPEGRPEQIGIPPRVPVVRHPLHGDKEQGHRGGECAPCHEAPAPGMSPKRSPSLTCGEEQRHPKCKRPRPSRRGVTPRMPLRQASAPCTFCRINQLPRKTQGLSVQRHAVQFGREDIGQERMAAGGIDCAASWPKMRSIPQPVHGNPAMKGRKASK